MPAVGRFRINVFRRRGVVGLAIRRVRSEVPTVAELLLPPVIEELADTTRGLVLVTGPTGHLVITTMHTIDATETTGCRRSTRRS
jgi:Tfp pilus assembly pilus retraction ATPase PilT